jgi:S-formylglutathione hydrolase FrmB
VAARERELDVTVEFAPGAHEWAYWDRAIAQILEWLPR